MKSMQELLDIMNAALEESAPFGEPSQQDMMADKLSDAYQQGGEEGLCKAAGCTMQELDQEINEICREKGLHPDDDRDECIQLYIEELVDNADYKDHGEYESIEENEDDIDPKMQGIFNELGITKSTYVLDGLKEIPLSQVGPGYWLLGFDRDGSCFEISKEESPEEAKNSITNYGEYKVSDAEITELNGARYYWNENMPDTGVLHITEAQESEKYEGDFEPIEEILEREDTMVIGAQDGQLYCFDNDEQVMLGSTPEQVADGMKKCGYHDGTSLYGSSTMDFADEEGFNNSEDANKLLDDALEILHGKNEDINKANDFEDDIKQKEPCPQCGSEDCTCPPGECDCDPVHEDVNESYPYGMAPQQDQETETINYSKTKKVGDSTLTISANAKSLEELQELLQMAGLNPEKAEDYVDPYDKDSDDVCDCCGKEIVDGDCGCDDHDHPEEPKMLSYSTDKKAIVDMLRNKLAQKLQ